MRYFACCLVLFSALSTGQSLKYFDFGFLEKGTGKWTTQFDPNTGFESGTCSANGQPIKTYVCRQPSEAGQKNTLVGRYSQEGNCCVVTDLDGNAFCKSSGTEYLLRSPTKFYNWVAENNGVFDPARHQNLLIGSAYDYADQFICRFQYQKPEDGQSYTFQGSQRPGDGKCRTGVKVNGQYQQVVSNIFDVLIAA